MPERDIGRTSGGVRLVSSKLYEFASGRLPALRSCSSAFPMGVPDVPALAQHVVPAWRTPGAGCIEPASTALWCAASVKPGKP